MAEDLILYSLSNLKEAILPALEVAKAKVIVEIGSECGAFSRELFAHAERSGGKLITIDPAPDASALEFMAAWRDSRHFQFLQMTSHEAIPKIPDADAYIIDGDHNYYTVRRELELIHETQGDRPWLAFLHDVGWPWGRRDLYYSPKAIPSECAHPSSSEGGVSLDHPGLVPWGFGNPGVISVALRENGPKNGVRTAVEDFLAERSDFAFHLVPAIFGLGVLCPRDASWTSDLQAHLAPYVDNPVLARMEQNRIRLFLRMREDLHQRTSAIPKARFLLGQKLLSAFPISSRAEFDALWAHRMATTMDEQEALVPSGRSSFVLPGKCSVCGSEAGFITDFMFASPGAAGKLQPAWRERQICRCGLNCRHRSSFHILTDSLGLGRESVIFCTEQRTGLFQRIRHAFPRAVGGESLGEHVPPGTVSSAGIRNEDLTRLSFATATFDAIFSLDVLDRAKDFRMAIREMARCLKPGGRLLLTIPFAFNQDRTLQRATVDGEGRVTHHAPPVYQGDPSNSQGVLRFTDFGWDFLNELRAAGFPDAALWVFSEPQFGYVGLQVRHPRDPSKDYCPGE